MDAVVSLGVHVSELVILVMLAGWVAERLVDLEGRMVVVSGIAGVLIGSWLWSVAGWDIGPRLGDIALAPIFGGAILVSAALKMVVVGAAGPRW